MAVGWDMFFVGGGSDFCCLLEIGWGLLFSVGSGWGLVIFCRRQVGICCFSLKVSRGLLFLLGNRWGFWS